MHPGNSVRAMGQMGRMGLGQGVNEPWKMGWKRHLSVLKSLKLLLLMPLGTEHSGPVKFWGYLFWTVPSHLNENVYIQTLK